MTAPVNPDEFGAARTWAPRHDRKPVELTAYAVLEDGTTTDVTLLDLSYEGCRVRPATELAPGTRIKLSVLRRGGIDAEVRWFKDGLAGLVFDAPEAHQPRRHWPRKSERVAVSADVIMRRPGQPNYQVRVLDASPHGCKVEFVDRPCANERMWIKFEDLEALEAEVAWVEGHVTGLRFAKTIHPAVFDLLVERLG